MKLRVGSWPWLLRHELRLALRGYRGVGFRVALAGGAIVWLIEHAGVWLLLRAGGAAAMPPSLVPVLGTLTLVAISLMLAQAIGLSVSALFERGDLDLLLASPVDPQVVLLVRSLGIAATCASIYLFFLSPFANVGAMLGWPALLAIYPAVLALALLAAAIGMLLTLWLVSWLGARRARSAAQVMAALVGAAAFLVSQARALLGPDTAERIWLSLRGWSAPGATLDAQSALWLPFRALTGEPGSLFALCAAGILSIWFAAGLSCRRFLEGTQATVTGSARRTAPSRRRVVFHGGLVRNVLVKEWKLIVRDPNLIAQTLLQTLYLLPLMFIVYRQGDSAMLAAPLCILVATTLVGNLAWITVAAEDAPELIAGAPVRLRDVRWIKVLAAVIPVCILLSPMLAFVASHDFFAAVVFMSCVIGATVSGGTIQVWCPQRGKRSDLKRRTRSSGLSTIIEFVTGLAWAGVAWALLFAPLFTLAAAPFVVLGPGAAWIVGRRRREAEGLR